MLPIASHSVRQYSGVVVRLTHELAVRNRDTPGGFLISRVEKTAEEIVSLISLLATPARANHLKHILLHEMSIVSDQRSTLLKEVSMN